MTLTPEQLEFRKNGLGASEIPAICGMSPFQKPTDIWMQKTGLMPLAIEPNEAMDWGNRLEDAIARAFCEKEGHELFVAPDTLQHKEYGWAMATPDRIIIDKDTGEYVNLQIKNVGPKSMGYWKENEVGGIPDYVTVQVQWEMFVTDTRQTYVAALLAGTKMRSWNIIRNDDMISQIFEIARRFWEINVKQNIPPNPDDPNYLKFKYPNDNGNMLEPTDITTGIVGDIVAIKGNITRQNAKVSLLEDRLKGIIGESAGITGLCTFRTNKKGTRTLRLINEKESD